MRIFKSIKKAVAWSTAMLLLLTLIVYGGYKAVRSPYVQTRVTQYIAGKLSEELKAKVSVDGVDIGFFNRLILEGFYLEDQHGDTLGYIQRLHLGIEGISLEKRQLLVGKITLDSLFFHLHKYEGDQAQNIQFLIDYFKTEKDTVAKPPWDIRLRDLQLKGATFRLYDETKSLKGTGIDYRHLHVSGIDVLVKNIRIDHDTIMARIDGLALRESHGFVVNHLAGDVRIGPTELKIDGLRMKTPVSELALDLHYTYTQWADWLSFIDKVNMSYDIDDSEVSIADVAFFAPALKGIDKQVRISGRVDGPVSSLNGRGLNIWYGRNTNLQGDVDMDGLPDMAETFMYLNLKRLVTNYADLASIPIPPFADRQTLPIPPNVATLGTLDFKGNFTGFINDFVAFGRLNTSIGQLQTDLALKQNETTKEVSYKGKLASTDFGLGTFLGTDKVGLVSLNAEVDGKGLTSKDINAKLQGVVRSAELMGYAYQNINVDGTFIHNIFEGSFDIDEENIALDFNGTVNLSGEFPTFNFHSEVAHANLYKLKLLKEREDATVSGVMDVNFTGNDIDNLLGSIVLSKVTYQQKDAKEYTFSDFELRASEKNGKKTIVLKSDIMDAEFVGQFALKNIPKAVNNILSKHLPSYASEFNVLKDGEGFEFDFNAQIKNVDIVSYFVAPQLSMSDGSHFEGTYSTSRNEMTFTGTMPGFSYAKTRMTGVRISAMNPGKEFNLDVKAEDIHFSDSMYIANVEVNTYTFSDSLGLRILWNNNTTLENSADINGVASFPRNAQIRFRFTESRVTVADLDWSVVPNNLLTVDSTTFHFQNVTFSNRNQTLGLNGRISKDPDEKLNIQLGTFDLSNLNLLTKKSGITLDGTVSGDAQVSNIYEQLFLTNKLTVDSLTVNEVLIGSGQVNNIWKPKEREVNVMALLQRKDGTGLRITGKYMPGEDRPRNFDLGIQLDRIPLSLANPYIRKIISNMEGTAKADLSLKGTNAKPELEGYIDLNEASLLFNYLNTNFRITDRVLIKKDGFYMQDLKVKDERGMTGSINGWVKHTNFKDFRFDASLNVNNFYAMNTTSALNPLFYGKAYGSGVVRFSGVPKNMHLELSMRTDRGSRFFIPLFGAKSVKETNFITFINVADTISKEEQSQFQVDFANLTMDLDIQVTPDAEVQLIFDPTVGDIIKGSGQGDIRLALDRAGEFKMFGEFTISKGEYLFTLQNVINKRFSVKPGGRINWSGSPYDALVDLVAVYGLRTTLADLMYPDTNIVYKRRMQVDCILKMTENLLNPTITFDIDLPNADANMRTDVINRIGVANEQEMNRQVFALLVLNKFLPTEEQNIGNEAGGFFSANSAELLSNQLSNWLSRISNDFDVGLNYRPGSSTVESDEVEVALSTQLFNNRIVIDGNLGVANSRNPQAGQSSSNIVGDVNIEYKITPDGRFRVRAFNRSNDVNANAVVNNSAPFTQGVGISYRKEFNNWADLFKSKKKKQAALPVSPRVSPMLPEDSDSDNMPEQ